MALRITISTHGENLKNNASKKEAAGKNIYALGCSFDKFKNIRNNAIYSKIYIFVYNQKYTNMNGNAKHQNQNRGSL